MKRTRRAKLVVLGAVGAMVLPVGLAAAVSTLTGTSQLDRVGAVSADNGFPTWYKDKTSATDVRLAGCLDGSDANCALAADSHYDPAQPTVFPTSPTDDTYNFPEEFFYWSGTSVTPVSAVEGGGTATLVMALEGAFAAGPVKPGDQVVFARIRVKMTNVTDGNKYLVTYPYGQQVVTADAGRVFFTEDIGLSPGEFQQALNGRIGPFLRSVSAPAGYLGDGATETAVTGSPYTDDAGQPQNYFKIEKLDGAGNPTAQAAMSDQFAVLGKVAKNLGVTAEQATYKQSALDGGSMDVYASSEPDQAIQVQADPAAGYHTTSLRGDGAGHYYARLAYSGAAPPTSVTVLNASDNPVTKKTIPVTDRVDATRADYDADTSTLSVAAGSSDSSSPPTLTVKGFGNLAADGTGTFNVAAPPPTVTVTSSDGGTDTETVNGAGAAFAAEKPLAVAGSDQAVQQGQPVTLDGSGSLGEITSYQWTQDPTDAVQVGPLPSGAKVSFTAPAQATDLHFKLTVSGPGGSSTDSMVVGVAVVGKPVANPGPDQTAAIGRAVTLDGTASTGASSFRWVQAASDPVQVNLSGASTAKATFTMPASANPLHFALTVTGPGGTDTKSVQVSQTRDSLAVTTARYRLGGQEWRVDGTATVLTSNLVTIKLVPRDSTQPEALVGTASVDPATGTWSFRNKGGPLPAPTGTNTNTIHVTSSAGGDITASVQVTN